MSSNLKVDWCSYEAAKYAVEHWHYSRKMPAPKWVTMGIWENEVFKGCVVFSRGGNNNIGKPYGLDLNEVCELTRIALTKHQTPVSKIISICLKMLKKNSPGLRLVVSYADTNEGHHGGVYQAGNWIYVGRTNKDFFVIDSSGKKHHSRAVSESGLKSHFGQLRRVPKPSENKVVNTLGKHKYLYALDNDFYKKIKPLSKAYPKRDAVEVNGVTSGDLPRKGGSSPTQPLMIGDVSGA